MNLISRHHLRLTTPYLFISRTNFITLVALLLFIVLRGSHYYNIFGEKVANHQ